MLGGAAFNFFGILAACILIPRQGSIKRVANFGVFLVELIWSIWAYVWLFIVFSVRRRPLTHHRMGPCMRPPVSC